MQTAARALFFSCLAALAVGGCGGGSGNSMASSPTAPSGAGGGALITGAVSRGSGATIGLTVTVVGTDLSAVVKDSGYFEIARVPSGTVQLRFKDAGVDAMAQVSNVSQNQVIEIQVQIDGASATIVNETRSNAKVSICHRTGEGSFHLIDISSDAEPAHRAHGDAKVGEPVPGTQRQVFDAACVPTGPAVAIEKSTNGDDADNAPGPSITVGAPVTWRYVVTNTGTIPLTGIAVSDDRGVAVTCNGQTTLAAGQSMTCTGSGVATLGQYVNVGTVTAGSASGSVSASDASHYLGVAPETSPPGEAKVQICHKTGAGFYVFIEIGASAEPAHRAHGDGKIGEAVPGSPGKVFGDGCSVK